MQRGSSQHGLRAIILQVGEPMECIHVYGQER